MIPVEPPDYQVGTDLFHYKKITSLTMVETEIIAHHNTIAGNITKARKNIFFKILVYVPEVAISGNSPQYPFLGANCLQLNY